MTQASEELLRLADEMEAALLPRYALKASALYGTNASNNAWHYTQQDEAKREAITQCAEWLRTLANKATPHG